MINYEKFVNYEDHRVFSFHFQRYVSTCWKYNEYLIVKSKVNVIRHIVTCRVSVIAVTSFGILLDR